MPSPSTTVLNGVAPLSVVRMVWKNKLVILLLWGIVSAATFICVYKLPATYRAQAVVIVDSQKIPDRYVSATVNTDLQDRLANISQQILGASRLQKIIDDFGLYRDDKGKLAPEEILAKMQKAITLETDSKGFTGSRLGAFRVGYEGPDAAIVAQVANRISNLYVEENLRTREVQAQGTEEFIDNQLQAAKKILDELEGAVSKYKLTYNGQLPQQEAALSGTLSRLQSMLEADREAIGRAQQNKLMLQNTLGVAESTVAALSSAIEVVRGDGSSPAAAPGSPADAGPAAGKRSETIQQALDLMAGRYSQDHPEVKRLQRELARQKQLEQSEAVAQAAVQPKPAPEAPVAPRKASQGANLAAISNNLKLSEARERVNALKLQITLADNEAQVRTADQQRILREIAANEARIQKLPIREQEMASITRDYDIAKSNYKALLDKKLSAGMATAMEHREKSERFEILDPAQVPIKPIKPNRPLLCVLGCIIGLILGLAVGLGTEFRKGLVLGEWELPSRFPILGRLPNIDLSTAAPEETEPPKRRKRQLRRAVLSSAVVCALGAIATGVYFISQRF